ncbi:hypothetical protein DPEC_G00340640 [Dallia pectoralis]|uniref:Uncharacterized protein n=1 Tax=Dallia pectoralis TaxID=75939 RepID=A0ACC2F576_DALPE|nr:hypothetical protein DPEC_G00340640 [Dallia pectoralis]
MEFLRSLVPASISGEGGAMDTGGALPRETGPRLLRMKRLGLLAMGQTIEEDQDGLVSTSIARPTQSNKTKRTKERDEGLCGLAREHAPEWNTAVRILLLNSVRISLVLRSPRHPANGLTLVHGPFCSQRLAQGYLVFTMAPICSSSGG